MIRRFDLACECSLTEHSQASCCVRNFPVIKRKIFIRGVLGIMEKKLLIVFQKDMGTEIEQEMFGLCRLDK